MVEKFGSRSRLCLPRYVHRTITITLAVPDGNVALARNVEIFKNEYSLADKRSNGMEHDLSRLQTDQNAILQLVCV